MYAFYVVRGFTIEYLEALPIEKQLFYIEAMNKYYDNIDSILDSKQGSPKHDV